MPPIEHGAPQVEAVLEEKHVCGQRQVEALLALKRVTVERAKHGPAEGCDNAIGGYCGVQLRVGFTVEGWFVVREVQIDVVDFVELKGRKGRGREMFDNADNYGVRGVRLRGQREPDPAAGNGRGRSILELELIGGCGGIENVWELAEALTSKTRGVTVT